MSLLARRLQSGSFVGGGGGGGGMSISPVRSRRISENPRTNGTTFTINYPASVSAGDRLVLWIAADTAQTFTASGWTELAQNSSSDSVGAFWKTAAGTEGGSTFDVTYTTADREMAAIVWAIPSSGTPEISSIATGTSTTPNPPSLTPSAGAGNYVWLACFSANLAANRLEAWPNGFGALLLGGPASAVTAGAFERLENASTVDPSALRYDVSTFWSAATIAVPVTPTELTGYPVLEGTAESAWSSVSSSQTMNLPASISSGDYLLAEVSVADGETASITGWTQLATVTQVESATTYIRSYIFERTADGTEGATATVTVSGSGARGSAVVRRFTNADSAATEVATFGYTGGGVTKVQWTTLTPTGGSGKIAWVCGSAYTPDRAIVGWSENDAVAHDYSNAEIQEGAANAETDGGGSVSYIHTLSAVKFAEASSFKPDDMATNTIRFASWVVSVYPSA